MLTVATPSDDDEQDDADDDEEDEEEVGRIRNPRSLNFNFIQLISGDALASDAVLATGGVDATSFRTLAKNFEAHWFNCGLVEPGMSFCRLRHLT